MNDEKIVPNLRTQWIQRKKWLKTVRKMAEQAPFHIESSASLTTHHSDYDQFWKDNFSRLLRGPDYGSQPNRGFCDLKLTPEGGQEGSVWTHRALLSRVSGVFKGILSSASESEEITEILIPGSSRKTLELFVRVCYEGMVEEIGKEVQVGIWFLTTRSFEEQYVFFHL